MAAHYVLVGSGIAAVAAAEAIRERDPSGRITMVSLEPHPFYSRPGLAYLLRGDIPEKQLAVRSPDDVKALKLNRAHATATDVRPAEHELVLSNGTALRYDRLLLATGALAVPPPFPGGDLTGVVKLDSLDDTNHILGLRGRAAVVVGGGITALELVEGLHARGVHVHYFLRGTRYMADVLDETESGIVLGRLRAEGVEVHLNTQIKEVTGTRGRVSRVVTQDGKGLACDVVGVAIGVRPRVELAKKAGLKVARGVLVNEYLQSSSAEVFAAGDAAEVLDPASGKTTLDVLWPTAVTQGRIAGANMTGAGVAYTKSVPFNVTQMTGLKVTIIGAVGGGTNEDLVAITRGESEAWRILPKSWVVSDRDDVNRVRLVVGERAIAGARVMGDQTWSRPLQKLILGRADVSTIREELSGPDALARLARFYRRWEQARGPG
ncbi:MAG: NAD(P)/FAD-dependent oxidoreductase [Gemmata sp.]